MQKFVEQMLFNWKPFSASKKLLIAWLNLKKKFIAEKLFWNVRIIVGLLRVWIATAQKRPSQRLLVQVQFLNSIECKRNFSDIVQVNKKYKFEMIFSWFKIEISDYNLMFQPRKNNFVALLPVVLIWFKI